MTDINEKMVMTEVNEFASFMEVVETIETMSEREVIALTIIQGGGIADESCTAGEVLHSGRIIVSVDGLAYEADVTNRAHHGLVLGMSLNNADQGSTVNIRRLGKVSNLGGLTPNTIYYYNSIGVPVTDKPAQGSFMTVGFALSETEFNVQLGIPIWR